MSDAGVVSHMSGGSQIEVGLYSTPGQTSPSARGHASPDLCTSCGASQRGAESPLWEVGERVWSGPAGGHSVSSQLSGQEPSPRWLWALEAMLFYSLILGPALPGRRQRSNCRQGSDSGIGGVPTGAGARFIVS